MAEANARLSTGHLGEAAQRILRALAQQPAQARTSAYQPPAPAGQLTTTQLAERAQLSDDAAFLSLLWRLERDGFIHRDQINRATDRPNQVRLTDAAWIMCRARGWDTPGQP